MFDASIVESGIFTDTYSVNGLGYAVALAGMLSERKALPLFCDASSDFIFTIEVPVWPIE